MRVLHLSAAGLFGGVETFLLVLARNGGRGSRMESHFALSGEGRVSAELRRVGAPLHPLGPVRARHPLSVWRARSALARVLGSERFDVAVCHSPWAQAMLGPAVRAAGVPLVFYLHGHVTGKHWLERLARRTPPDLVIANSRFTEATLANLYPGVPHSMVHYPVEPRNSARGPDGRTAIRGELSTSLDDVVIVQTSRMEEWKGHRLHLEALARLRAVPGWTAWLVGGAQRPSEVAYRDDLVARAERLGIADRVRFTGERHDVPDVLAAADIHCQPNQGPEPFGIAFVEALYAGLPVVTTALGGALEIVDPGSGVLTPPDDAGALARTLEELIADPVRRRALGAAGPVRAADLCAPERQLGKLADALGRVVARPNTIAHAEPRGAS